MPVAPNFGMEAQMDRQKLRRDLHARVDAALDRAIDAVAAAPDGRWIAGSEWVVRAAFQELMGDCFQAIVQARVDADPVVNAAAGSFSPAAGGRDAGRGAAAVQGRAAGRRADRRR
jgi:hypothetical protein